MTNSIGLVNLISIFLYFSSKLKNYNLLRDLQCRPIRDVITSFHCTMYSLGYSVVKMGYFMFYPYSGMEGDFVKSLLGWNSRGEGDAKNGP